MTDPHIRSFDDMDQLFTWIRERGDAATAALHDRQKAITFGSRVISFQHDILIFGHIYDQPSFFFDNARSPLWETEEEWSQIEAGDAAGRAYGVYFSVVTPTGEIGGNHKLNLWPIHEDTFSQARSYGWEPRLFPEPLWLECSEAVEALADHLRTARS